MRMLCESCPLYWFRVPAIGISGFVFQGLPCVQTRALAAATRRDFVTERVRQSVVAEIRVAGGGMLQVVPECGRQVWADMGFSRLNGKTVRRPDSRASSIALYVQDRAIRASSRPWPVVMPSKWKRRLLLLVAIRSGLSNTVPR
jgi:hypothetical protein